PFLDGNGNARGNHPGSEPRGFALRNTAESFDIIGWFTDPAYGNQVVGAWNQTGIDPTVFDRGEPVFTVTAGSLAATGARWDNLPSLNLHPKSAWFGSFQQVPFAGAVGTGNDWTQGWANFSINADYG